MRFICRAGHPSGADELRNYRVNISVFLGRVGCSRLSTRLAGPRVHPAPSCPCEYASTDGLAVTDVADRRGTKTVVVGSRGEAKPNGHGRTPQHTQDRGFAAPPTVATLRSAAVNCRRTPTRDRRRAAVEARLQRGVGALYRTVSPPRGGAHGVNSVPSGRSDARVPAVIHWWSPRDDTGLVRGRSPPVGTGTVW